MRVAVVAPPDPGHFFPAAGLAVALRDRGHEALLVGGTPWAPALRRDGLGVAELPAAAPGGSFARRLYGQAARTARPLADVLRGWRPDLVVCDLLLVGGGFAAELSGLPWVELIPHALPDQSRHLPPTWSGLAPGRGPLGRARDTALRRLVAPT
ncbi:MAG TPA: hypothetical protein VKP11_00990, partial [Frankiaceae bacterium]|nr:hypothetical protein [Frankiaceae bacterium]